jgi:hypothetical protein
MSTTLSPIRSTLLTIEDVPHRELALARVRVQLEDGFEHLTFEPVNRPVVIVDLAGICEIARREPADGRRAARARTRPVMWASFPPVRLRSSTSGSISLSRCLRRSNWLAINPRPCASWIKCRHQPRLGSLAICAWRAVAITRSVATLRLTSRKSCPLRPISAAFSPVGAETASASLPSVSRAAARKHSQAAPRARRAGRRTASRTAWES